MHAGELGHVNLGMHIASLQPLEFRHGVASYGSGRVDAFSNLTTPKKCPPRLSSVTKIRATAFGRTSRHSITRLAAASPTTSPTNASRGHGKKPISRPEPAFLGLRAAHDSAMERNTVTDRSPRCPAQDRADDVQGVAGAQHWHEIHSDAGSTWCTPWTL